MGGKLDFYITPAEQRNVFQKTIMTGGMSTTDDDTMLSWDNNVFLDGDRQRKCLTGDL